MEFGSEFQRRAEWNKKIGCSRLRGWWVDLQVLGAV